MLTTDNQESVKAMKLSPGDEAVPFATVDIDGRPISLDRYRGKPLLLMFFRFASCPMCNLRIHDFAKAYSRLHDNGLEAVAFFNSSAIAIKRNSGNRDCSFSLVPDPNQDIYRDFAVRTSWLGFLKSMMLPSFYVDWFRAMRHGFWGGADLEMAKMPADFLVGPNGRFLLVHYGNTIGDHLSVHEIEHALAKIPGQEAVASP